MHIWIADVLLIFLAKSDLVTYLIFGLKKKNKAEKDSCFFFS